ATATGTLPSEDAGNGSGCSDGSQCMSGNCVDNVCCTSDACTAAGERCDIPGEEGRCHAPVEVGRFCWLDNHCQSGFCVDGACCTVATCQPGESCNEPGHAGECEVLPTPSPTGTANPTRTAAATRTPIPIAVMRVGTVTGDPGDRVTIAVTLDTGG